MSIIASRHAGSSLRWWLIVALAAGFALSALPIHIGRAAATIVVNSTADKLNTDGLCTLREAIIAANKDLASSSAPGECAAGSGTDTIILPAGTYVLTRTDAGKEDASSTGDLDITQSVTISGAGAATTIIDTSLFKDRVFHILGGSATISGVTIKGGKVTGDGGGIYNKASLTLNSVTLTGNTATSEGGGILNASTAMLTVTNSTISGNSTPEDGGGIYNMGTAALTNVTLSGNAGGSSSGRTTGGFYNKSGSATLTNVTVAANAGGNLRRYAGTVSLKNTIVANAISGGNCSGTLSSLGNNLSSDATCAASFNKPTDLNNTNPLLGPLANNGGQTFTHALAANSPAVEGGTNVGCPATDQRGVSRPRGVACDIGAYEVEDPAQTGPVFTVNTNADTDDGVCGFIQCSLREAINAANARPNGASPDQIVFNVPGNVIQPASALPSFTDRVVVDGGGSLQLKGGGAGGADGLTFSTGGSTLRGLTVMNFGGAGVRVLSGTGTTILDSSIVGNNGLGIDLGGDGVTPNDTGDADTGPNGLQNFPVLIRAVPGSSSTKIDGRLNSAASTTYTLRFFANAACDPSGFGEGQTFLGSTPATTDATGDVYFSASIASAVPDGQFVTATATDPNGSTSEFSRCLRVGADNTSWVSALRLALGGDPLALTATSDQFVDKQGQSRWFKFSVRPGSKVRVTLTGLPANYDLTLYKDIPAAFKALNSPQDLIRLGAEFAPDAFSPDAYSPDAYSPDAFSPDAYSPDAFSPDAFSPDAYSPDAYSPDAFSPDAYSPDAYSPDAYSPDAYSPDAYSPDAYSPDAYSPDAFSPDAYSGAQSRSLIAVSAFNGTASEGVIVNTWDNSGDLYVRVRGRNGVYDTQSSFHMQVTLLAGACGTVTDTLPVSSTTATAGNYKTIILTDLARMAGSASEKSTLQATLATFAARPEVAGVVVDAGADARVAAANAQADAHVPCPYAKNLVAYAIKDIVDGYRAVNPLEYVVIVGSDDAIPFFRHPDQALLASEKNFVPPVRDNTASQASLKLGYVLSQDRYGARFDISVKGNSLPIADLAIGRLVETASDATGVLNAYLGTTNGVAPTPTSALVTGYDFLEDAARAVRTELEAGIGAAADALITARNIAPTDPRSWNATDLRNQLLNRRHDLIFLAGHFSANSALAADYTTRLASTDVAASAVDLSNAVIFSAGCHAGYNIVDAHGVPLVTREPDWAQTFARKGAALIAGTGYQYGDTDFIEYSERLYLDFAKELRAGSGPVAIGKALIAAKQAYLGDTPQFRAIHEKAYLETTLFGLPMLSVNMPGARTGSSADASIVSATNGYAANPGLTLGLRSADVTVTPSLTENAVVLNAIGSTTTATAMYLAGANGVVANPAEPVLPLETRNVGVATLVLRGVGFLGGTYTDQADALPLIGAATTEIRGVHAPFVSSVFYPVQPWSINSFDALVGGATRLIALPAQFQSSALGASTGTLRRFDSMNFRLYYSNNIGTFANGSTPALAAAPAIVSVSSTASGGTVTFNVNVVGNPAAGIQEVWVTYSATSGPLAGRWQSLPLTQSMADSTQWSGSLPLGTTFAEDFRFMVQAVNGVGLVSLATNLGEYYTPGADASATQPTALTLEAPPSVGAYGTRPTFSAVLTSNGAPLSGQSLLFGLGSQRRFATTDVDGRATASIPLIGVPGSDQLRVSFGGTSQYIPSSASSPFEITKQSTLLTLTPPNASGHYSNSVLVTATLADAAGRPLGEKTVLFVVTGSGGSFSASEITDYAGRATLGSVPLAVGAYTVKAYFSGAIPLSTGETLTLDDERYEPSTATGSLDLTNHAPTAMDDTYGMDEGSTLSVAAPGVLGNDGDVDADPITASLVNAPAHGSLTLNANGSFTYTPSTGFGGMDTFTYTASDGLGGATNATVRITVRALNRPPVCSGAYASEDELWPPNSSFHSIRLLGVTDPDGNSVSITITRIFQDEPVGSAADAIILGLNSAKLRAERDGNGNGRVYHIFFTASDGHGGSCSDEVKLGVVPHDQSHNLGPIDGGPLYDSTVPQS